MCVYVCFTGQTGGVYLQLQLELLCSVPDLVLSLGLQQPYLLYTEYLEICIDDSAFIVLRILNYVVTLEMRGVD